MGRARTLAQVYRHFGEVDAAETSPLYERVAVAVSDSVVAIAVRRQRRFNETGHGALLYPATSEAARRVGAKAVGLIDVGCSAGLNLNVDRVGTTTATDNRWATHHLPYS